MMITADSQDALDEVLNGLMNPESVPTTGGLEANDAYGDIYGKVQWCSDAADGP